MIYIYLHYGSRFVQHWNIPKVALLHGKVMFHYQIWGILFSNKPVCFFSFLKYFPTVKHIQLSQILSLSPGLVACLDHLNSAISICPYFTTIIWATLVTSLVSTSWSPKFIIAVLNSLLYKQPLSIGEFNTSSTFCFIDLDLIADRHPGMSHSAKISLWPGCSFCNSASNPYTSSGGFTTTAKVMLTPAPPAPPARLQNSAGWRFQQCETTAFLFFVPQMLVPRLGDDLMSKISDSSEDSWHLRFAHDIFHVFLLYMFFDHKHPPHRWRHISVCDIQRYSRSCW